MIKLTSVSNPKPAAGLESAEASARPVENDISSGAQGTDSDDSRSLKYLCAAGRAEPRGPRAAFESVIGPTDDRVRVLDTDLYPWRMICALRMHADNGVSTIGTGWLVGPRTIITAGHCVYSTYYFGGWASTIEVSPGRNGSELPFETKISTSFSSVDRWVQSEDPDFDIGCIHLAEPIGDTLGWFAAGSITPDELAGYQVNVSGYPSDRGNGTEQYHHRNQVLHVTDRRVFYDVDTFGGQSGAPVWIHEEVGAPPIVIGIHAYGVGGSPGGLQANSAPRIIPEVMTQIREWVARDGGWPSAQ